MNVSELLEELATVLENDSILIDKSTNLFGERHNVFLGYNLQTPPDKSQMPAIVIDSVQKRMVSEGRSTFIIVLGVLNADETITSSGNKIVCNGFLSNEKFREEICKAILRNQKKFKAKLAFSDGGTFHNLVFPVFSSTIYTNFEYMIPSNRLEDYL